MEELQTPFQILAETKSTSRAAQTDDLLPVAQPFHNELIISAPKPLQQKRQRATRSVSTGISLQKVQPTPSPAKFWMAFTSGLWLLCAMAQAYMVFLAHEERGSTCVATDGTKFIVRGDQLYASWVLLGVMLLAALLSSPYCLCCVCCRECVSDPPIHVLVQSEGVPAIIDI